MIDVIMSLGQFTRKSRPATYGQSFGSHEPYATVARSWNLLEKPFLRLKRFVESKPSHKDSANNEFVVVPH